MCRNPEIFIVGIRSYIRHSYEYSIISVFGPQFLSCSGWAELLCIVVIKIVVLLSCMNLKPKPVILLNCVSSVITLFVLILRRHACLGL